MSTTILSSLHTQSSPTLRRFDFKLFALRLLLAANHLVVLHNCGKQSTSFASAFFFFFAFDRGRFSCLFASLAFHCVLKPCYRKNGSNASPRSMSKRLTCVESRISATMLHSCRTIHACIFHYLKNAQQHARLGTLYHEATPLYCAYSAVPLVSDAV